MAKDAKQLREERKQFIRDYVKANPLNPDGGLLISAFTDHYHDANAADCQALLSEVYPESVPWEIRKVCPNVVKSECTTEATTMRMALAYFGHRCGKRQLQSYCKACRNRARREARAARREKEDMEIRARQKDIVNGKYRAIRHRMADKEG